MHGGIYRCTGIYFFKSASAGTLLPLVDFFIKKDYTLCYHKTDRIHDFCFGGMTYE